MSWQSPLISLTNTYCAWVPKNVMAMSYIMSISGVATLGFQYGSMAKTHGTDDPHGEGLGNIMPEANQI